MISPPPVALSKVPLKRRVKGRCPPNCTSKETRFSATVPDKGERPWVSSNVPVSFAPSCCNRSTPSSVPSRPSKETCHLPDTLAGMADSPAGVLPLAWAAASGETIKEEKSRAPKSAKIYLVTTNPKMRYDAKASRNGVLIKLQQQCYKRVNFWKCPSNPTADIAGEEHLLPRSKKPGREQLAPARLIVTRLECD